MFAICSLMNIPLEEFPLVATPIREPEPVVPESGLELATARNAMEQIGLLSTDERNPHDELTRLGLVKGHRGPDSLGFFGLYRLFSRSGTKRGV
jgi:hypothetical protein